MNGTPSILQLWNQEQLAASQTQLILQRTVARPDFNPVMTGKDANMFAPSNAPKIDIFDYPSVKCSCGNEYFVPAVMFRQVPGLALGTSEQTVNIPIKVFVCAKCGELSPIDKETMEEEQKSKIIK